MTIEQNRVRKGVREGGQFAADIHSEASVQLAPEHSKNTLTELNSLLESLDRRDGVTVEDLQTQLVSIREDLIKSWDADRGKVTGLIEEIDEEPGITASEAEARIRSLVQDIEAKMVLSAQVNTVSDARWSKLVYEDRGAHEERRSYARAAVDEALDNDDFDMIFSPDTKDLIREEAEHDAHLDQAIDDLGAARDANPTGYLSYQFGSQLARLLEGNKTEREHMFTPGRSVLWTDPDGGEKRAGSVVDYNPDQDTVYIDMDGSEAEVYEWELQTLEQPSWKLPTAAATRETAAAAIGKEPAEYRKVLEQTFPHVDPSYYDRFLEFQKNQPESWQDYQLGKLAIMNENIAAHRAKRVPVGFGQNPHFTTQPLTALEEAIDRDIVAGYDPFDETSMETYASGAGQGYGSLNIKDFVRLRLDARRPGSAAHIHA